MRQRAIMSVEEYQRDIVRGGVPLSRGVMRIEEPNGQVHLFAYISGGYGLGALPYLNRQMASAQGVSFPGSQAIQQAANDFVQQQGLQAAEAAGRVTSVGFTMSRHSGEDGPELPIASSAEPNSPSPRVLAVYPITAARRPGGHAGFRAGGGDFFITLGTPAEVRLIDRDSFGLHPDGKNGDMRRVPSGVRRISSNGLDNNGNNGCISMSSQDSLRFEQLFWRLRSQGIAPDRMYVLQHDPSQTLPSGINLDRSFPNIVR